MPVTAPLNLFDYEALAKPLLWGLAVGGAEGVADVLVILQNELAFAMALRGRPTIADIDRASPQ